MTSTPFGTDAPVLSSPAGSSAVMSFGTAAQRRSASPAQRWMRWIYWGLFCLALLLNALYAVSTWRNQRQLLFESLDTSSGFLVSAAQSYLQNDALVLQWVAADVQALPDPPQAAALQVELAKAQRLLPDTVALSIVDASGRMLGSSLRAAGLPDVRQARTLARFLGSGPAPLRIGRPVIDPVAGVWVVPLACPVAAHDGRAAFDVIASVRLGAFMRRALADEGKVHPGTVVILAHDDGYVLARWPAPLDPAFVGRRHGGAFMQSLQADPGRQHDRYAGLARADGTSVAGSWRRLPAAPELAVAVAVPSSLLWRQFLPTVSAALIGLGVFLLLLTGVYRYAQGQIGRDLANARLQQQRLRQLAMSDPLTGIGNRLLLRERLEQALDDSRKTGRGFGLLLLGLDGFKQVNDAFGHSAGDDLLREAARRLRQVLNRGEVLARMGGDEFAAVIDDGFDGQGGPDDVAARILAALRRPFDLGAGRHASVSASLGGSVHPADGADVETLLRRAGLALDAAKSAGRDRVFRFRAEFEAAAQRQQRLFEGVEQALHDGRLMLHYQPIVSISGDPERPAVVGVEALLRLRDPTRGIVPAAEFAEVLDHGRLARPIGRFALDRALHQGALWREQGLALHVAVNISAEHLLAAEFLDDLQQALRDHPGFPAPSLVLEVTESAPLRNLQQARQVLQDCLDLGVNIALDDFGTGAASLTYLQQLPAQSLKIDQSFVRDMVNDPKDFAIVSAVVTAANLLGLEVIGEGAETLQHLAMLAAMDCTMAQGHAIAPALPADAVATWVQTWTRPVSNLRAAPFPREVEVAQLRRVERLQQAVRGEAAFPDHVLDESAENQCHLGLWLNGQGRLYYGRDPRYATLREQHARIHRLARDAKAALDRGDADAALRLGDAVAELSAAVLRGIRDLARSGADPASR